MRRASIAIVAAGVIAAVCPRSALPDAVADGSTTPGAWVLGTNWHFYPFSWSTATFYYESDITADAAPGRVVVYGPATPPLAAPPAPAPGKFTLPRPSDKNWPGFPQTQIGNLGSKGETNNSGIGTLKG